MHWPVLVRRGLHPRNPCKPHGGADAPQVRCARGAGAGRGRHGCGGKAGGVRALALRPLRARGGVTGVYRRWCSRGRVRGLLSLGARSWRRAWAPAIGVYRGFGGGYGAGAPALSAIPCAPFPDRMSAYVWRNWFVVPVARLARMM